jgi:hypothetical protein
LEPTADYTGPLVQSEGVPGHEGHVSNNDVAKDRNGTQRRFFKSFGQLLLICLPVFIGVVTWEGWKSTTEVPPMVRRVPPEVPREIVAAVLDHCVGGGVGFPFEEVVITDLKVCRKGKGVATPQIKATKNPKNIYGVSCLAKVRERYRGRTEERSCAYVFNFIVFETQSGMLEITSILPYPVAKGFNRPENWYNICRFPHTICAPGLDRLRARIGEEQ